MTDSQRTGTPAGATEATWQWQQGEQVVTAASAPPSAPEPVPTAPVAEAAPGQAAPAAAALPPRDYEAELAARDVELKGLQARMESIEGASQDATAERQKMVVEMARLVNEKEAIERTRNGELVRQQQQLEEVSQATQTLTRTTQALEQKLAEAEAKATKLDVLTSEFPHLIKYAQFIPVSTSVEEVRGYCEAFQQTRESDLTEYRQMITSGYAARTATTGVPATRPAEPVGDPAQLEAHLASAMSDPRVFEESLAAAIRNYEARKP